MLKDRKIILNFGIAGMAIGVLLVIKSYLLPAEFLDKILWFICGPVVWLQMFFGLPEILSVPLVVFYYLFLGIVFEKIPKSSRRKLIIFLAVLFLIVLHYLTAMQAAKILGGIIEDVVKGILRLFGIAK